MNIDCIRVQNFRCIHDSGDLPLTADLTILIGENESGKSSLLDALTCFNQGQEFQDVDISTMSPTRGSILNGEISKDTVDIVTIAVKLSTNEREQLKIPASVLPGDILRITKRLDNSYLIKGAHDTTLSELYASFKNQRLLAAIRAIRRQIGSVYQGAIVRKRPMDQFVFIRRSESAPESADLILFPNTAGSLWEELSQGDIVQVTQQAPDPYDRNIRAMNVGKHIDLEGELNAVESSASLEGQEYTSAVEDLSTKICSIPPNHPLRSIFGNDFQDLLLEHIGTSTEQIPWDDVQILGELPRIEKGFAVSVSDKIALKPTDETIPMGEYDGGLLALIDEVGLSPSEAVMAEHTERIRIFDEKSHVLSKIFSESWGKDVQAELVPFNQDKELGLAIASQGSLDPPSRRSQGFNSYLGLTARLLELRKHSKGRVVLILDDPAMHLHPTAQERLSRILGEQPFQVLAATHFPFMISSDRLDRVRLLCRTESGAYYEQDWKQAGEGLLLIRGALSRWTLGKVPLLVEGQSDRTVLKSMSELLMGLGEDSMASILEPLPSGGSAMPETARALRAMDVQFIALVDGDQQGDDIKKKLITELDQPESAVVSLRDVVSSVRNPEIEHLFSDETRNSDTWSQGGMSATLDLLKTSSMELDDEAKGNIGFLFAALNESLDAVMAS